MIILLLAFFCSSRRVNYPIRFLLDILFAMKALLDFIPLIAFFTERSLGEKEIADLYAMNDTETPESGI